MIHVFIGIEAQHIKMVPLLRHMDAAGVGYHLNDSGQHTKLAASLLARSSGAGAGAAKLAPPAGV